MSRLAIALLLSSSVAAAAAVQQTDQVMPAARYAKAASHGDGSFRVAAKTCEPYTHEKIECVGGNTALCTTTRTKACRTTKVCRSPPGGKRPCK